MYVGHYYAMCRLLLHLEISEWINHKTARMLVLLRKFSIILWATNSLYLFLSRHLYMYLDMYIHEESAFNVQKLLAIETIANFFVVIYLLILDMYLCCGTLKLWILLHTFFCNGSDFLSHCSSVNCHTRHTHTHTLPRARARHEYRQKTYGDEQNNNYFFLLSIRQGKAATHIWLPSLVDDIFLSANRKINILYIFWNWPFDLFSRHCVTEWHT